MCYVCDELRGYKCRHCKCYFKDGKGQCDDCIARRIVPDEVGVQKDRTRRGVCRVCARVKRDKCRIATQNKQTDGPKSAELWKQLSAQVRDNIEKQFRALRQWLDEGGKEIAVQYRRIEAEEGWLTYADGDLKKHFHNWCRRKQNKLI